MSPLELVVFPERVTRKDVTAMKTRLLVLAAVGAAFLGVLTSPAQAQVGGITGSVPSSGGVGIVVWGGGTVDALESAAAAEGCELRSIYATVGGRYVGFVIGAPPFVNATFAATIGMDIPTGTPLVLVCVPGFGTGPETPTQSFRIDFIDVGQGDATLITVGGERLLIDGGRSQARIEERLVALGITEIHAVLSTHPDADHVAGLVRVLQLYDARRVYLNGAESSTQTYTSYLALAAASDAEVTVLQHGDAIPLGGLTLDVLHPAGLTGDSNADSLVVLLSCGTVDVLLTGDATVASEASMLAAGVLFDIDVLKVGHHGSNTSTGQPFLDVVRPEYAVISAGMNSQYGHPHAEVVARLVAIGAEIYHTDTTPGDDTVTMTSDCSSVEFDATPVSFDEDGNRLAGSLLEWWTTAAVDRLAA